MDDLFLTRMLAMECREDAITEVFASLLEHPALRGAFLRHVVEAPQFSEAKIRVDRQYENRNARGIPDVALHGEGMFVLIENKLGAPLTVNQPCQYLQEVLAWTREATGRFGCLVMQAPEKRLVALSAECDRRVREARITGTEAVRVRYVSWERTAKILAEVEVHDPVVAFIRSNFSALVSALSVAASAPITKEDLMYLKDPKALGAFSAVQKLMGDLQKRADREDAYEQKMWWDFSNVSIEVWPRGDKSRHVYVVCSFDAARRLGGGPLWLQLSGEAFRSAGVKARLTSAGHQLHASQPDWVEGDITPLELVADLDPPEQVERLWEAIVGIMSAANQGSETPATVV